MSQNLVHYHVFDKTQNAFKYIASHRDILQAFFEFKLYVRNKENKLDVIHT